MKNLREEIDWLAGLCPEFPGGEREAVASALVFRACIDVCGLRFPPPTGGELAGWCRDFRRIEDLEESPAYEQKVGERAHALGAMYDMQAPVPAPQEYPN